MSLKACRGVSLFRDFGAYVRPWPTRSALGARAHSSCFGSLCGRRNRIALTAG